MICFAALSLTGCLSNRVIFVDGRDAVVRLDDDVRGHVFVQDDSGKWVRSARKVTVPAGWYAGYVPATNFAKVK